MPRYPLSVDPLLPRGRLNMEKKNEQTAIKYSSNKQKKVAPHLRSVALHCPRRPSRDKLDAHRCTRQALRGGTPYTIAKNSLSVSHAKASTLNGGNGDELLVSVVAFAAAVVAIDRVSLICSSTLAATFILLVRQFTIQGSCTTQEGLPLRPCHITQQPHLSHLHYFVRPTVEIV